MTATRGRIPQEDHFVFGYSNKVNDLMGKDHRVVRNYVRDLQKWSNGRLIRRWTDRNRYEVGPYMYNCTCRSSVVRRAPSSRRKWSAFENLHPSTSDIGCPPSLKLLTNLLQNFGYARYSPLFRLFSLYRRHKLHSLATTRPRSACCFKSDSDLDVTIKKQPPPQCRNNSPRS